MFLDIKVTTWQRFELTEKEFESIKNQLEQGVDLFEIQELDDRSGEFQLDYVEWMSKEENDNLSTVELFNSDGDIVWEN